MDKQGEAHCQACSFAQYDLLTLLDMAGLGASVLTGSGIFLIGALSLHAIAAYTISRRRL